MLMYIFYLYSGILNKPKQQKYIFKVATVQFTYFGTKIIVCSNNSTSYTLPVPVMKLKHTIVVPKCRHTVR